MGRIRMKKKRRKKPLAPTGRKGKPILQALESRGSPHGWSKLEKWLGCRLRAWLDEQEQEKGGETSSDTLETRTGSVYHAFQDRAVKLTDNTYNTSVVEFTQDSPWDNLEEARAEAEHMFKQHRSRYPLDYLGTVLHSEYAVPQTQPEAELIHHAHWNRANIDLTCRIDRVVRVNKRQAKRILGWFGCVVEPGLYLVDFKTSSSLRWADRQYTNIAPRLYQMLWNATMPPKMQAKGMFLDVIAKTHKAENVVLLVPAPDEKIERIVARHLDFALACRDSAHKHHMGVQYSTKHCWDFGRFCSYGGDGQCPVSDMMPWSF